MSEGLSPAVWVLIAAWAVVCVIAMRRSIQLWRGEIEIFPRSLPSWRAYIRPLPLGVVAMIILLVLTPLSAYANAVGAWPPSRSSSATLPLTLLIAGLMTMIVVILVFVTTVTLFNWPKALVPPPMRDDPGLVQRGAHDARG